MTEKKSGGASSSPKAPAVSLEQDDAAGTYSIGATIDGVFVPFYTRPIVEVQSHIDSQKAAQESASASSSGAR